MITVILTCKHHLVYPHDLYIYVCGPGTCYSVGKDEKLKIIINWKRLSSQLNQRKVLVHHNREVAPKRHWHHGAVMNISVHDLWVWTYELDY